MKQQIITTGNRAVVITDQDGRISAKLYVNARNGLAHADITLSSFSGKTMAGAIRWAHKKLNFVQVRFK